MRPVPVSCKRLQKLQIRTGLSSSRSHTQFASAPALSAFFFAILTFTSISLANFDRKLVNFFLKLVLPVILKEIESIFLISTLHLLQKLSHN